jgi:hypothetical protein
MVYTFSIEVAVLNAMAVRIIHEQLNLQAGVCVCVSVSVCVCVLRGLMMTGGKGGLFALHCCHTVLTLLSHFCYTVVTMYHFGSRHFMSSKRI